jgi:hypothetical protein
VFNWIWQETAAGLGSAIWAAVWQWGLGVGLIIICLALAYLSPLNKRYFLIAAAIIAVGLFIYARGQLTEHAICDAKIKYIYLRAHPNITKKNIAANWRVSPQWQLGKPYSQTTTAKRVCQPLEWGCP